ncbi:hypothetical protein B0H21DRAFT_264978 [Amylocystis lapponica]|nr:hypothetical protein B0H21DRAFT_264978 [Amylocystis lapponica]
MADSIGKWAPGTAYGPVLSQTDLYMLDGVELEIHPIFVNQSSFNLIFNVSTGQTGGWSAEARDRELPFTAKDEPATLPRVDTLIVITELSPWCTIVKNANGVTLGDVCTTVWREYTDNMVTDKELESLPPRTQEQVRRFATNPNNSSWQAYYSPAAGPARLRRGDWLRDRQFFDKLVKKDAYIKSRLGYTAPNIFVMVLQSF